MHDDPSSLRRHWSLEPGLAFLNHGSFGACPIPVLERQQALRRELERQPVQFYVRELEPMLDRSRECLARFLDADAEELVWVANATTGVNAVLRSLTLAPGDELLTTDHEYNACRNALNYVADRSGATVVVAEVPFPLRSPDEVVERVLARVTPRTRLALLDHVTSQTAMVLPLERIVAELRSRAIDTLVDGAHAPGMLELSLRSIGATYYTGNCHKWLCAPKGAGFLYVARERQDTVRPTVISHGANSHRTDRPRIWIEFDWVGTTDPTPALCVPAALEFMGGLLDGGWQALRRRNRELALEGRRALCDALGIEPPCPDSMIGSLAAVPLPPGSPEPPASALYADPLQDELLRAGIEVPVIPWPAPPERLLRVSAQIYNRAEEYRALADTLRRRFAT